MALTGFSNLLARRGVLLLLAFALLAITAISVAGMAASVMVAETVQGSSEAINVAGSLRRLTHRAASLVLAEAFPGGGDSRVEQAIAQFEEQLVHPGLLRTLERQPSSLLSAAYHGIEGGWHDRIKPHLRAARARGAALDEAARSTLLDDVDAYVEELNTMVRVIEHDTEARLGQLRNNLAAALATTLAVVGVALVALNGRVLRPLADLARAAGDMARGDFSRRVEHTGRDELGRVGEAFNHMADDLAKLYHTLEQRVADQTAELTRSNRSLALLYHAIGRLYHAPADPDTYTAILRDIETVLGLSGSFACMRARHEGGATILADSLGGCAQRDESGGCALCPQQQPTGDPWQYQREVHAGVARDVLRVPLSDAERRHGLLRLALPAGQRLDEWQRQLLEALSRHMGIALGIAHRTEQERLLALQEERSIIARELHDSLAQSLSYMKIQASLLAPLLGDAARRDDALAKLADLREGINAAYRQLRELLSSFRLRMDGSLDQMLALTVEEYAARGNLPIHLELRLGDSHLSPNQEVHLLHIVREALSNVTRHAQAHQAWVRLSREGENRLRLLIDDDGRGFAREEPARPHHYGLAILAERSRALDGELEVGPRPDGGCRVSVRFPALREALPLLPPARSTPPLS